VNLWLQIAMTDAARVRGCEAMCDLMRDLDSLPEDHRRPRGQRVAKRAARQQLAHDEPQTVRGSRVVDSDDVGMIQGRDGARFPLEAFEPLRIGQELRWQNLDRDVAPKSRVAATVDLSPTACAKQAADLVRAESRSERQRQVDAWSLPQL
jgi:hypothetical protein